MIQIEPTNINYFMKRLVKISFLLLLTYTVGFTQSSSDNLDPENLNLEFLALLIKQKIDSVRLKRNREILVIDTFLVNAAQDHADYLKRRKSLTHTQTGNKLMRTPPLKPIAPS